MKLVDILASELKHWPSTRTAAVGQSNSGSLHLNEEPRHGSEFFGWTTCKFTMAEDCQSAWVTRAEWQAAVDALNAPKVVEWDGEGMPPVGSASCEYLGAHKYDEWTVVNIFAHYGHTVFVDFGDGWRAEDDISRFRPVRTAEQVAAEEREKAINEMVFGVCGCEPDGGNTTAFMICGFIYDSGYRKEPKPCGS